MNCLIVGDEPSVLDLLENYVGRTPFLQLAGRAGSVSEALQLIDAVERGAKGEVDLLFLDLQMPQFNGLEFFRILTQRGRRRTKVIFTTVFGQYALEVFRMDVWDYLFKPVSYTVFLRVAMKAHDWFRQTSASGEDDVSKRDGLWVRSDYRQVRIAFDEILYIEGMKDYVRIRLANGDSVMTQMSLKAIGEQLPEGEFARVHRSYIVHMPQVRTMERSRIVFDKVRIPVSGSYRDVFMKLLAERAFMPEDNNYAGEL